MDDGSPLGGVVCPAGFNQGRPGAKWNRPDVLEHQSLHETKPMKLKTSALPPEILRNQQTLSLSLSHIQTHTLTHTHLYPPTHTLTYSNTLIHSWHTVSLSLNLLSIRTNTLLCLSHNHVCMCTNTPRQKHAPSHTCSHTHVHTLRQARDPPSTKNHSHSHPQMAVAPSRPSSTWHHGLRSFFWSLDQK